MFSVWLLAFARLALFLAAVLISGAALFGKGGVNLPTLLTAAPFVAMAYLGFLYLDRHSRPTPAANPSRLRLAGFAYWLAFLLVLPWGMLRMYFGAYNMDALLFHLSYGVGGALRVAFVPAVFATFMAMLILGDAGFRLLRRFPRPAGAVAVGALALVLLNPLAQSLGEYVKPSFATPPRPLYPLLTQPRIEAAPDTPRNLVVIYLEGLEAGYGNRASFGDAYAPLERLGRQALVFDRVGQFPMTDWSVAGMVASQCGLPLVPRGLFSGRKLAGVAGFLPGRTCLGDILVAGGYRTGITLGAALDFGGLEEFVDIHGFQSRRGLAALSAQMPRNSPVDQNEWGLQDEVVFDAALARIGALQDADQPFFEVIETIGTHGPEGFLSPSCRKPGEGGTAVDFDRSVACLTALTEQFVTRLAGIVDMDQTLVVILSDHLAHPFVPAVPKLALHPRHDTVMVLGAGVVPGVVSKPGTMIDVYPTILEIMGYQLAGRRAGLGVSLLAPEPGLPADTDPRVLREDRELARRIWEAGAGD